MANQEHIAILKQGVKAWNEWRKDNPDIEPNLEGLSLSWEDLSGVNFSNVDLTEADLYETNFNGANLSGAILSRAHLYKANFVNADLQDAICYQAELVKADFIQADLNGAILEDACLNWADFSNANLMGADLTGAKLNWANLSEARLCFANLTGCSIYAISAWNVNTEGALQSSLVITPDNEPEITVDNLEVAQFVYLLLNNSKIRQVIDTITSKVVLILGRFTPERKAVLDALRNELRNHNYSPVVFDFDPPKSQDLTETVSTLAHLARFVIVDLTDPSSAPHEIATIAPQCIRPIKPIISNDLILKDGKEVEKWREYAMLQDLRKRYHWILDTFRYQDIPHLIASLQDDIIKPVEEKINHWEPEKEKIKEQEKEIRKQKEENRKLREELEKLRRGK